MQLLKVRAPAHPPSGGTSLPSATAPVLEPYDSARNAENAYIRPRDRRLSRKTRAALGKQPGSVKAMFAVSSADNPDQLPSKSTVGNNRGNSCCCCKPQEVGAASVPFYSPLAESARLMPVTASPMPAHAGALAGLIS